MKSYACRTCGHIHREAEGEPLSGIVPGTRWEDLPEDWICPDCGASKQAFAAIEL